MQWALSHIQSPRLVHVETKGQSPKELECSKLPGSPFPSRIKKIILEQHEPLR